MTIGTVYDLIKRVTQMGKSTAQVHWLAESLDKYNLRFEKQFDLKNRLLYDDS